IVILSAAKNPRSYLDSVPYYGVYTFSEGVKKVNMLSIGQVARRAGVGVETVRYYEREGLLEEPPRRASGYRQYSEEVIKRLHFIKCAQKLGFSLKEINELLLLRVDAQTACEEVKQRTEAKIAEVERKLFELQCMRQALIQVAALCEGQGPNSRCPMLEALDQQESLYQSEGKEE
ncbi:MAG TPA: MerR family transcriptional regulator, partial [Ktedonobacteraceae bacterium]